MLDVSDEGDDEITTTDHRKAESKKRNPETERKRAYFPTAPVNSSNSCNFLFMLCCVVLCMMMMMMMIE